MRISLIIFVLLTLYGCSKPPDLNAPCREFGKYCSQQPINDEGEIHEILFK